MNKQELIALFKEKDYLLRMGSKLIASRTHSKISDVKQARAEVRNNKTSLPKILLFDVETAPMRAYVWGRWKQNINLEATISEWYMLCWSAKWLYSNEVISDKLTSSESIKEDDKRIVEHLWELVNEADIVIAYNGKKADIPWMNTRFVIHNLIPPTPYFLIDPCDAVRKYFGFSSNKLDALAGYFNIEHKMDTDFSLWNKAVKGDEEALNYMSTYCSKDVLILEEVYLRLRPYIKNHPNIGNYCSTNIPICSKCGDNDLELIKDQYYYTSVSKYNLYRCKKCGSISRGRVNLNNNKVNLTSICK